MRADLHVHTTASDGVLSPSELICLAIERGVGVVAITDHDSVDGIAPALVAARECPSLRVIPGVEVSTDIPRGEVHILGYFVDYMDPVLVKRLQVFRRSRRVRAQRMVAKLADLGLHVRWERVRQLAGAGSIGRPHVAQAMLEKGYVCTLGEAFNRYIGRNGPAYVEREKMTPSEAVDLVIKANGLPVLAHPANIDGMEELVDRLHKVGLVGIEVYYSNYGADVVKRLASVAHRYGLVACGGSDYHGLDSIDHVPLGGIDIPPESIEQLFDLARGRGHSALVIPQ